MTTDLAVTTDLYVCRKCKGSTELAARLAEQLADRRARRGGAEVAVRMVRCQDVCKAPVAGLAVDGRLTWFRRVRGPKARAALAKLAVRGGTGPLPKRLAPHHVAKRDGRTVKG
ncbi:MAG: hypothetical protein JWM47_3390 [Acidimicrobiales bacterium]|nr:hypothetical protein [Acidimicrobiales bacterium]